MTEHVFPGAFCKIVEDLFDDEKYCCAMHADGAGTKSILAYIYYKETGNAEVFKGISQDSLTMNIDDLLCIGVTDNFIVSNTIGRNAHRIDGMVLENIIDGYHEIADILRDYDINIIMSGGETADVGDIVSTIIIDSTVFSRLPRKQVIDCSNIQPGDVIIGLASFGKSDYEKTYNSGIGSNGFTAARHLILSPDYIDKYPETFSNTIDKDKVYCGQFKLEEKLPNSKQTIGDALLSPTRTYAPVIKEILSKDFESINGLIHCTGGGQVKCKSFGENLNYIKDNLFQTPPIFQLIELKSNIEPEEMYQVFNMGHRMEIYCSLNEAEEIIDISKKYGIDAKIVGRVKKSKTDKNQVTISHGNQQFVY